jgi:hypothetical protein
LQTQGLYPKALIDVELSSDEDAGLKPNALADQKNASTGNDTGDGGVSSTEPIAPKPISSDVLKQSDPSATGQVSINIPLSGGLEHKLPPATRWNMPILQVDQVMTQVELPPYRGPRSTLDLIAIEIIFGHIFEAF